MSGPHEFEEKSLIIQLRNTSILAETKMEIMQCAVAKCPKVCISAHGIQIPSLLDSGSEVTLLRQSYFDQHILPKIKPATGEKADAHCLFKLTVANDGQMPIKMYTELDLTFLGLKVPKVGVLIAEEPNQVLDKKHQTRLPGIIGWNLIRLSYDVFIKKYGTTGFDSFICLEGVNPLLFSQLCIYHHSNVRKTSALGATSEVMSQNISISKSPKTDDLSKKKDQLYFKRKNGAIGQVTVGSKESPVCIPGNSALTVPGQTNKIPSKLTCLVEQAQHHNLPPGIVINRCLATTKARSVPVILVNTTRQNVWIWQPLLAAELFGTDQVKEIEHRANMEREGDNIQISFSPVAPDSIRVRLEQVETVTSNIDPPTSIEKPSFGPRPDVESENFDFKAEVDHLPFKLNMGTMVEMTREQQSWFINIIYDHPEVFSLHDEDLGFCNKIKHTIPMTLDRPVYLPHRTIPPQLLGEVHKCLDTWLRQGIIRPSQSPYASQVVIVRKKTGEIRLCMDYRKLNSITVRDAFPLPRIDEALQAVHSSNWFSSFDLAQGYLQLAMDESDIKKTAFRAGSMGLYEFTHMPFGLSNAGSSFCRLMEQCLGDQQFVTLLLYLDDICIFAPTIDKMLDRIELVFDRLKQFNLKIKPKKCQFFDTSVLFLGHILSAKGISANPEKVEKVRTWPVPRNIKEVQSFLGLASYYRQFIDKFAEKARCLHELVGPTSNKHRKARAKKEATTVTQTEPRIFEWTTKHQEVFDALKEALSTAPVLGYPDFSREFILEIDASLKGLGAILSQQGKDGQIRVIAYASCSLHPSERSMCNYSSAKLELLVLKWAVTEKFRDYLLGS